MNNTGPSRYALLFLSAALLCPGCGSRSPSSQGDSTEADVAVGVALIVANEPTQDVLIWTMDRDDRITSHWLRGNRFGAVILASREGLLFPMTDGIWEIETRTVDLPLCDCDTWTENGMEGSCPVSNETATGESIVLVNLRNGDELSPVPSPDAANEEDPAYTDHSFGAGVIASVGPYLFIRSVKEVLACGAAHNSWSSQFTVFDVARRETVEILTDEERSRILEEEQTAAFNEVRTDNLVTVDRPEDLELTTIKPGLLPGVGLTIHYQFTADSSFADSDDNWGSYSRSVIVPARNFPEALAPYAALPPAMSTFAVFSDNTRLGGWIPISGEGEQIAAIAKAFGVGAQPAAP